jgi:hypothetical protein
MSIRESEDKRFAQNRVDCHDDSCDSAEGLSIRERTLTLFAGNPHLKAKKICEILRLNYREKGRYINSLLSDFKCHYDFGLPQKALVPHRRVFVWKNVEGSREKALGCGWEPVKNRNGMLVFRGDGGSVHWYKGGLVRLCLRGELQLARAKELFSRAFGWFTTTRLCKYVDAPTHETTREWVFDVGSPLPRFDIRHFEGSLGIRIYSDGSHPRAVEVRETEPLWLDRFERVTDKFAGQIEGHLGLIKEWRKEVKERQFESEEHRFLLRTNYRRRIFQNNVQSIVDASSLTASQKTSCITSVATATESGFIQSGP